MEMFAGPCECSVLADQLLGKLPLAEAMDGMWGSRTPLRWDLGEFSRIRVLRQRRPRARPGRRSTQL